MATRYLSVADGRIAYDDLGRGPLVLCVPSMGDVRGEYRFLAPLLAAAGMRVVSMDVRGHGETSPDWPDYSVGSIGSDMLALIRELDAGPAVILGTSMAAGAAVWAAAEAPGLVSGLVLISPFVRGGGDWMGRVLALAFSGPWGPALWQRYYTSLYPSRKPADFGSYSAALRANLGEPGRAAALGSMLKASKIASEQSLGRVSAKTLVLMGSKDPDFKDPEAEAQWVAGKLCASYTMLPGAGHYPHAEMPEAAAPLVISFIKSLQESVEKNYAA